MSKKKTAKKPIDLVPEPEAPIIEIDGPEVIGIRNAFSTPKLSKTFTEPTRTKQGLSELCNIHSIVARHQAGEQIFHLNPKEPAYGDFSNHSDLQTAIENVRAAEDQFSRLPSELRAACDNDPVKFLQAIEDPDQALAFANAGAAELVQALHGELETVPDPPSKPASEGPAVAPKASETEQ